MQSLLVVDVGNSSIVLGIYRDEEFLSSWRLATSQERTADEYGVLARQLVAQSFDGPLDGAIVASVVPPLNATVREMIEQYFDVEPLFVEPGVKTGLSIHTDNPLEVGADRIVNAVAAHHLYGGPAVVVDFGTATTFDLVTADAEYRGGIIAPGLLISAEALFSRAARLPRVDVKRPATLIGTNTVAGIQSGIYYGYIGLVDGILERLRREQPLKLVVATGSLAELLTTDSKQIDRIDADLTLKGLKIIYDRNQSKRKSRRP